jgi:ABC-type phosphate transport system permease subunit
MAIVVISGLMTSTFLSLLVIPVVFSFVDDALQRVSRYYRRCFAKATEHSLEQPTPEK